MSYTYICSLKSKEHKVDFNNHEITKTIKEIKINDSVFKILKKDVSDIHNLFLLIEGDIFIENNWKTNMQIKIDNKIVSDIYVSAIIEDRFNTSDFFFD